MQAVLCRKYGPPESLELTDVPRPVPREGEVLIHVAAAGVNAGDWHLVRADPFLVRLFFGLLKPKHPIPGSDVAGRVEAVGPGVKELQPGDAVFGDLSGSRFGAFAEYACAPANAVLPKPAGLSFEEAAAVPVSAVTALQGLRKAGRLQSGQRVLIHGASGGVGTYAVQIAKALGAEVTGVCSTGSVDLVRSLGADRVIDYTREDFAAAGPRYDLILGVGGHRSLLDYRRALNPGGAYVQVGGAMAQFTQAVLFGPWLSMVGKRRVATLMAAANVADLRVVSGLIEEGKLKPAIDRKFPLSEVPRALRYLETGHPRGKVVIDVRNEEAGH